MKLFKSLFSSNSKKTANDIAPSAKVAGEEKNDPANEAWLALVENEKKKINECVNRLKSEELGWVSICQTADVDSPNLCVVSFFQSDLDYLIKTFWEYDRMGDREARDITGYSISNMVFKDNCRPEWLQGNYQDIDWKDFMALILPYDYFDKGFLYGYGGETTALSIYNRCYEYQSGNYDGFYYVKMIDSKILLEKSEFDRTPKNLFSRRREVLVKIFGENLRLLST